IAAKHHSVPAAVALGWLSAQPNIGGPIASATSKEQLTEILSSSSLNLDSADMQLLGEVSQ
ncbi:aldo/keto reductase, partial [Kaistella sp.]|uniref:aldo/keto reductase n=1 Tax=Kaistella sp. TaxID=2782235 RepID=UPI002F936E1D